jgi:hypothetical protein
MTPELSKEIIVGCVAAVATALFTGVPAALLFWWTWQRDQERIIVKKLIPNWPTLTGEWVPERDAFGPVFNILIRNRSLFTVYFSAAGFLIDGEVIELRNLLLPLKMKPNPDPYSNRPNIADDSFDPREIPSQRYTTLDVYGKEDRTQIAAALMKAAKKHKSTIEEILTSSKVAAIVALQSGKEFTSETFRRRMWRRFKTRIKRRKKSRRTHDST